MNAVAGMRSCTLRIAMAHIGPATVEPCATSMYRPPTDCRFSVIGVPVLLAPAIIAAVASAGV